MNPIEVEVAKKSLDLVMDFARKVGGQAADELGVDFGNRIRAWRIANAVSLYTRTRRKLEEAGLPANAVPPRLFLPLIEAASVEDNESLQEMWAGLLAAASESPDTVSPAFVETLKLMTPNEAKYIDKIYCDRTNPKNPYQMPPGSQLPPGVFTEGAGAPKGLSSETYERLGIIRREYGMTQEGGEPEVGSILRFTKYGTEFLRTCHGPREMSNRAKAASVEE